MKVSTLRESSAMASPLPREMEEELVPAGSEPGTNGCRVELGGWEGVGRAEAAPSFCLGGWLSDDSVEIEKEYQGSAG